MNWKKEAIKKLSALSIEDLTSIICETYPASSEIERTRTDINDQERRRIYTDSIIRAAGFGTLKGFSL